VESDYVDCNDADAMQDRDGPGQGEANGATEGGADGVAATKKWKGKASQLPRAVVVVVVGELNKHCQKPKVGVFVDGG
jgi:hypothetical protein